MKTKHLVAIALGLFFGASCSNELPVGQGEDSLFGEVPEGMFEYRFTLKGVTPTRLSYAEVAMEEAEMKIHNGKVLVFAQAAAGTLADADKLVCVKDAKIINNKSSFLVNGSTNFYGAAKVAVLLISNWETSNIASLTLTAGTTTYKNVVDQLQSKGDAGAEIATRGLLQIGKAIDCDVPTAGQRLAVGNITIKRPFARFDIKNAGLKALSITGLKVKEISDKFYVLSEKFPVDAIFTHQKEVAVPAGLNRPADGSKPDPDPKFMPGVLYSYPGSVDGDDSPVLLVTGKLVTGAGKEQVLTDYEVPFAKDGNKLRIKTNTRYTLTLKAEVDGIVADITESFAEWGSAEDASLTYESNLNDYASVARIGEGLKLKSIAADGTLHFDGTKGQASYNFSVESMPEGATVSAMVGAEEQPVKAVAGYGAIINYVVELTEAVKVNESMQTINITGTNAGNAIFKIAIKHEGEASTQPKVEEYPVGEGKTLPAIKVGNLWWAPANVGAPLGDYPGLMYQYGRNTGWSQTVNPPTPVEGLYVSGTEIGENPYILSGTTSADYPDYWFELAFKDTFEKDIAPKWAAVSDGQNNPCPAGWRIPTQAEFQALLTEEVINGLSYERGTITLKLENEQRMEIPSQTDCITPSGVQASGTLYWTRYENQINADAFIFSANKITKGTRLSLAYGCRLRCVKDAVQ